MPPLCQEQQRAPVSYPSNSQAFLPTPSDCLLGLYTLKQHCMEVEYLDRVRMEDGISVYLILLTCEAGILSIFGEETKLGLFLPKSPLLPVST